MEDAHLVTRSILAPAYSAVLSWEADPQNTMRAIAAIAAIDSLVVHVHHAHHGVDSRMLKAYRATLAGRYPFIALLDMLTSTLTHANMKHRNIFQFVIRRDRLCIVNQHALRINVAELLCGSLAEWEFEIERLNRRAA